MTTRSDRDKTTLAYTTIASGIFLLAVNPSTLSSEFFFRRFFAAGACMLGVAQLADRNNSGFIASNPWLFKLILATMNLPGLYFLMKEAGADNVILATGMIFGILPFVLFFRSNRSAQRDSLSGGDTNEGAS